MTVLCYQDGSFLPVEKAGVPLNDLAVQRGYGVFEYIRTCAGEFFHWGDHLRRLHRSAQALHLTVPVQDDRLREIAEELVAASELERPAVRILLTGGPADTEPLLSSPSLFLTVEELASYPQAWYQQGIHLLTVQYRREFPGIKNLNYVNTIRLDPVRRRQHADDLLYYTERGITECPRSSFFAFLGEKLVTPEEDVLPGVTRQLVLDLAVQAFPVAQRTIYLEDLQQAEEAFVTSTSRGVVPVTEIDCQLLGSGQVGERTRVVSRLLAQYMERYQCR